MQYYSLDENHASATLNSRFIGGQNPYQLQNLNILWKFHGQKNPTWAKFLELKFFFICKDKITYQNKNQLVVKSSLYINITMKLLIKLHLLAQKQCNSENLLFWGSSISLLLQIDSSSFQAP